MAELFEARLKITELEAKIETDPLLNVLNRRGLERAMKHTIDFATRYHTDAAVLVFDLDDFKSINDRFGHVAGDAVLREVSALLVGNVQSSDIVARWGGDEMVVVLWNTNDLTALMKVASLESEIAALRVRHCDKILSVTASTGLTTVKSTDTPMETLARADLDMLARKSQGKSDRRMMIEQSDQKRECLRVA